MLGAAAAPSRRLRPVRRLLHCLVLFAALSGMSCPEGEKLLTSLAYTELTPPSSLFTVGAVVIVEDDGDDNVDTAKLKLCCGPRAAFGPHWAPLASETVAQKMMKTTKSSWKLSGDVLSSLRANSTVEGVKSIEATLSNARLMQISDADVLENLRFRSEDCKRAIAQRLNAGHALTLISSAIVADMTYKVNFEQNVKVDAKTRVKELQRLAASLGGGQHRIGQKTIESRGLVLGIRTDSFLLALSMPENEKLAESGMGERGLPARHATANPDPEANLVLPPGGYLQPTYSMDD